MRCNLRTLFCRTLRGLALGVFFSFDALGGFAVAATTPVQESEPASLITNAGEFWNVPERERRKSQRLRLELLVHYYDPYWKLLWGENGGAGCFLPVRGRDLPITAGQRVRFEGAVVPSAGISGDEVTVTVLAEQATPAAIVAQGMINDLTRLDARWVSIEGYVCFQREVDSRHLYLDVLTEGRLVGTRVLLGDTDPVPQLLHARIRFNGVYVGSRDPSGQLRQIDAWVPHRREITVLGWLDSDPRFALPPLTIDQVAATATDDWVHTSGELLRADPGASIMLRDATGRILVRTEQPITAAIGEMLDVIGRPYGHGPDATLLDAVVRPMPRGGTGAARAAQRRTEPPLKLRLVEQVLELRPDEAEQHFPAFLRGVVTWSDAKAGFFFLQDASGGIRVQYGTRLGEPPKIGMLVAASGVSSNGVFAPELELKELTPLEPAACPASRFVTHEQALTGAMEGQRVEMRGFLREVEHAGLWLQMNLTTGAGEFTAYISPHPSIEALVGSMVRITGVCTAVANAQRQLTGVRLWVAGTEAVRVEDPRASDPFSAPSRTIGSLRQFLSFRALDRHVRVAGVVLYDRPGRYLYLQQDNTGIMVLHRDSRPLMPGEWIEVVGLPGRDGNRVVLREAVWRQATPGREPVPLVLASAGRLDESADVRLVTIRGKLYDTFSDGQKHRFLVRRDDMVFEARLEDVAAAALPVKESVVELTGVYLLDYDEYHRPRGFRLQLRTLRDVRVIAAAPWWTAGRAIAISGGLAACALLGWVGVVMLRRRVRQQTSQIRAQLENQARIHAELERAARLESLGVLAGGIAHDFNNLLTVVMANLGLAAMDERVQAAAGEMIADAERGARRAAELTQQLLTFAKGGDPVRCAVAIADVVREAAEFARHGSRVRCDIEAEPRLPPADVDRAQISRVVHNLVLNAIQAMPDGGVVQLRLASVEVGSGEEPNLRPGRYVKLTVADDGPGIAPAHLPRIFDPYFSTKPSNNGLGLATVHSIVKKHQGHIRVRSEVGHGTTFEIWLPAAADAPLATARSTVACGTVSLRVLFMDDEEVIRRSVVGVLHQLGHEATIVSDGAEAVRAYEEAMRSGKRYDVVVLDLTVPGGLGARAAIEVLRRLDPAVRAIVSSGYSNDPVLANCRAFGFSAVVPKPYEISDLARAIQEVAHGPAPQPNAPVVG